MITIEYTQTIEKKLHLSTGSVIVEKSQREQVLEELKRHKRLSDAPWISYGDEEDYILFQIDILAMDEKYMAVKLSYDGTCGNQGHQEIQFYKLNLKK